MGATRCPAHLLLLDESLSDQLIDSRFHKPSGDTLPASVPLSIVDDSASVVINIGREFFQGAGQFLQNYRGRSPRLLIFLYGAVNFKHQIRQRLVSAEHITMPQIPFGPRKIP